MRIRPNSADAHNNLGLAYKHNADLNGAIAEYQEEIRLNPKLASAQNNLANALYARRNFAGAIEHYRLALSLIPRARRRTNLASTLDDAGKPDEAITDKGGRSSSIAKTPSIHYNLSIVYQKKKDTPAAIAELKTAARLAPDWPTPHIMLSNLLTNSDPKAAIDERAAADGLTHDAKLHDQCIELQKKVQ